METLKVKLDSGNEIEVWQGTFPEGHRLYKEVAKVMENIDLENDKVSKLMFRIFSSESIEAALWPCMEKAVYKTTECPVGVRINPQLFTTKPEYIKDFMQIQKEVLGYNLAPFDGAVALLLKTMIIKATAIPT